MRRLGNTALSSMKSLLSLVGLTKKKSTKMSDTGSNEPDPQDGTLNGEPLNKEGKEETPDTEQKEE
jgi:hypothetical protein